MKTIIYIVVAVVIGAVAYQLFFKKEEAPLTWYELRKKQLLNGTYTTMPTPGTAGTPPVYANPNAPNFGG